MCDACFGGSCGNTWVERHGRGPVDEGVEGDNSSGEQPTSSNHPTISSLGPRLDCSPTIRHRKNIQILKMLVKYSESNSQHLCLKSCQPKKVRLWEAFLGCQTGLADDGVTWLCEDIAKNVLFRSKKTSGESNPLEKIRWNSDLGETHIASKMPPKKVIFGIFAIFC